LTTITQQDSSGWAIGPP